MEKQLLPVRARLSTQFANIADNSVGIQATNLAPALRRIPAGFYTVINHSGHEWRTENKPSSVNHDVVEWTEPIPM